MIEPVNINDSYRRGDAITRLLIFVIAFRTCFASKLSKRPGGDPIIAAISRGVLNINVPLRTLINNKAPKRRRRLCFWADDKAWQRYCSPLFLYEYKQDYTGAGSRDRSRHNYLHAS